MILRNEENDWWWSSSVAMSCMSLSFEALSIHLAIWTTFKSSLTDHQWLHISSIPDLHHCLLLKTCSSSKDQQNEFEWLFLYPQRIPMTGKLRQQIHQVYFQPQFIAESNKGQRFFGGRRVLKWNITCFHQSWLYRGICTFKKMQMRADPIEKSSAKV
mgnify:CR=1 FL=1